MTEQGPRTTAWQKHEGDRRFAYRPDNDGVRFECQFGWGAIYGHRLSPEEFSDLVSTLEIMRSELEEHLSRPKPQPVVYTTKSGRELTAEDLELEFG